MSGLKFETSNVSILLSRCTGITEGKVVDGSIELELGAKVEGLLGIEVDGRVLGVRVGGKVNLITQ